MNQATLDSLNQPKVEELNNGIKRDAKDWLTKKKGYANSYDELVELAEQAIQNDDYYNANISRRSEIDNIIDNDLDGQLDAYLNENKLALYDLSTLPEDQKITELENPVTVTDKVMGKNATAWGQNTNASGRAATAWGNKTIVAGANSTAWGNQSIAVGGDSTAFGKSSKAWGDNSLAALGGTTGKGTVTKDDSGAITDIVRAETGNAIGAIAIGQGAVAEKSNQKAKALGTDSIVIGAVIDGKGSTVNGSNSIAIGSGHTVSGNNSGAFGDPDVIEGDNSYIIGNNSNIDVDDAFILGNNASVTANGGVALGTGSVASRRL